jgi:hypothetical protein
MPNKLLTLTVKGKHKTWIFPFYADPKYLDEWCEDGLEVNEVCNTIPLWVPAWGIRLWCFMQDVFNFKFREAWMWIRGKKEEG